MAAPVILRGAAAVTRLHRLQKTVSQTGGRAMALNSRAYAIEAGVTAFRTTASGRGAIAAANPRVGYAVMRRREALMQRGHATASQRYADALGEQAERFKEAAQAAKVSADEARQGQRLVEQLDRAAQETAEHARHPTDEIIAKYSAYRFDPGTPREEVIDFIMQKAEADRIYADNARRYVNGLAHKADESANRLREIEQEIVEAHGRSLTLDELEALAVEKAQDAEKAREAVKTFNKKADEAAAEALEDADKALKTMVTTDLALAQREAETLVDIAQRGATIDGAALEAQIRSANQRADYLAERMRENPRSVAELRAEAQAAKDAARLAQDRYNWVKGELATVSPNSPRAKELAAKLHDLEIEITSNKTIIEYSTADAEIAEDLAYSLNLKFTYDEITRARALSSFEAEARIRLIASGQTDVQTIAVTARRVAEARVALVEARTEAAHAAERAGQARKVANSPGATHPQREWAEETEKKAAEMAQALERANEAYAKQVTTIGVGGVTLATVIAIPSPAEAARAEAQEAGAEARMADEALAQAREAAAHSDAGLGELITVAGAAFKAHMAHNEAGQAYDGYVQARVDAHLAAEEAAKATAEQEAEARAKAYLASTPEGLAWEGMKMAGEGVLTGLHYAEEGGAYMLDAWGRYGMGLPVDIGHGALAAQDALIEHVVVPVAVATYEGAAAEANPMAPLEEARKRQEAAAERVALAAKIRDQDEIDKLVPMPTIITIPDAIPQRDPLLAEGKKDLNASKRREAAWAKIEEKARQSLEKNMSLIDEEAPDEELNMSIDPSLQSSSVPTV